MPEAGIIVFRQSILHIFLYSQTMAEPHDEGEIPELGDLADDLPPVYEGFEPISPGIKIFYTNIT